MEGEAPMKPMSREPPLRASISEGPALKDCGLILVPFSSFSMRPSWRPTRAVAWVRFGKYPMRTSDAESFWPESATLAALSLGSSFTASEP